MMTIKAIYFDIGGVLVRTIDRSPRTALAARLNTTYEALEEVVFGGEAGRKAQRGETRELEQWRMACQVLGWPETQADEFKAEFFRGDRVDTDLADFVRSLRGRYKTGVISNGMEGTRRFLEHEARIADAFDHLIISAEVGLMKPDARIFQIALQALGVQPAEAVFIDDFAHNVLGARAVGMAAIQFHTAQQARQGLEAVLAGDQSQNMG